MNTKPKKPDDSHALAAPRVIVALALLGMVSIGAVRSHPPADAPSVEQTTYLVDVNEDPAPMLELLPGIGPALAERIVQERVDQPFADAADLQRVRGIGERTSAGVMPYVRW